MMLFTDTLIESYEKYADQRESGTTDGFKERERAEFLKLLKTERRKTLLEIGCGPGRDAQFFHNQGLHVLAVDNAPIMVKLTAEKGVTAQILDCYNLDQIDETFDAVYTLNCLLHIPKKDISHIFSLIATRLNGNGLMYLGLWGGENFEGILEQDTYEPKRFFSFWEAEALLEVVQQSFRLEYYRRLNPRESLTFNSIIARKQ